MPADPLHQLIDALASCRRVLITTHANPDGDALGTTAAMALGLERKGIEAECLLLTPQPNKYEFVYGDANVKWHVIGEVPDVGAFLSRFDALLVCDTGTWSQLPGLREAVTAYCGRKLVMDHHVTQEDWADLKFVDTQAGAAAEMAMELLRRWGVALDHALAQPLYVAMATDTGWFAFSNTSAGTMRLAAECVEAGVEPNLLYQRLYQSERSRRMRLHAAGYNSLELLADEQLAVMQVTKADFEATGTKTPATEDMVNWPMAIGAVELVIFLAENPDSADGGPTKLSFRSKGRVDVAKLAEKFGGGGHPRAAGARIGTPLAEARRRVVEEALRHFTRE
jgi:phosphoesterase RecJ-like protein